MCCVGFTVKTLIVLYSNSFKLLMITVVEYLGDHRED